MEGVLWPLLVTLALPALALNAWHLLGAGCAARVKADEGGKKLRAFQLLYLSVYFLSLTGDWMQGPNVYRVYEAHGLTMREIGVLFVTGYGSSALFGTFASSLADVLGRRFAVVCYGVLYSVACLSRHCRSFLLLWLGRVVSGVCTSLLTSCFEAWMVNEHRARKLPDAGLRETFALQTFGSGLVAILAGLASNALVARLGVFAPFDAAAALLLLAAAAARLFWGENYGARAAPLADNMCAALRLLAADRRVRLLGAIQTLFEAPMFIFVFLWTPALAPPGGQQAAGGLPHGLVFACFMAAVMAGGTAFRAAAARWRLEAVLRALFAGAALALAVPVLCPARPPRDAGAGRGGRRAGARGWGRSWRSRGAWGPSGRAWGACARGWCRRACARPSSPSSACPSTSPSSPPSSTSTASASPAPSPSAAPLSSPASLPSRPFSPPPSPTLPPRPPSQARPRRIARRQSDQSGLRQRPARTRVSPLPTSTSSPLAGA